MSLTKNQKNQRTSRAWLFNKTRDSTSRTKKVAKTKKELSEQINKDVMAYINAGGQIQKCPSCAIIYCNTGYRLSYICYDLYANGWNLGQNTQGYL